MPDLPACARDPLPICGWCGVRTKSPTGVCAFCVGIDLASRREPTYEHALTGGRWVPGKGISVWVAV